MNDRPDRAAQDGQQAADAAAQAEAARPLPGPDQYFLIIGAMKAATSSLFTYLSEHPAICPSWVKEPEFFSERQAHKRDLAAYTDLWPDFDPGRHAWVMEASTGYTKHEELGAAARIHAHGIRPRMAYILRNPFDRIESHYNFMLRRPEWHDPVTHPSVLQTSNYYLHLASFVEVFGREAILVLDYDDLAKDPLGTVTRVTDFLGLAPLTGIADPAVVNVTQKPRSGFERGLRRLLPGMGQIAPAALKAPVKRLFAGLRPEKKRLTGAERAVIAQELAPDMARLQAEFGIDVRRWGF